MAAKVKKNKKPIKISTIVIYIVLILWAITTVFPFLWVFMNSFKESRDVISNSFALPEALQMMNYEKAFKRVNIGNAYRSSLIISGSVMLGAMTLSSMMAFAMTRYHFKGKKIIDALIKGSLMFPAFATIIPVMGMMTKAGFLSSGNLLAPILPQIAGNLSFATIVMMGFMRGLPLEMEEAAYMEGAGVAKVFTKIIIPLSKPSLATVAIFCFLWSYNDLFTQSSLVRKKALLPICALLKQISSIYGTDYGLMAAAVTLIVVPVMIVYILLQKNIIKGLTAGAVKG